MKDVYDKLSFENVKSNDAWEQGFPISYDKKQWNSTKKLNVIIVPHSHNDPGWLSTYEQYFESKTNHILNNMVKLLSENRNRTFIWSEISYLALWWKSASAEQKTKLKNLIINTKQFEIVTGGWVYN